RRRRAAVAGQLPLDVARPRRPAARGHLAPVSALTRVTKVRRRFDEGFLKDPVLAGTTLQGHVYSGGTVPRPLELAPMTITSRLRLATGALALTAFLAGCGDSTEPAGGGTTAVSTTEGEQAAQEHNEADTMFAQMMIVHHEGAVEMAQVAQEQA